MLVERIGRVLALTQPADDADPRLVPLDMFEAAVATAAPEYVDPRERPTEREAGVAALRTRAAQGVV